MGAQLVKMYDFVNQEGGVPACMKLAMATGLSSIKAAAAPDSPEMIAQFKAAIKEITGKTPS